MALLYQLLVCGSCHNLMTRFSLFGLGKLAVRRAMSRVMLGTFVDGKPACGSLPWHFALPALVGVLRGMEAGLCRGGVVALCFLEMGATLSPESRLCSGSLVVGTPTAPESGVLGASSSSALALSK